VPQLPGVPRGELIEAVIDGDGHVCEPPDLWARTLTAHLRERGLRLRWNAATGYDEANVEGW